jgi:hypothetical protein
MWIKLVLSALIFAAFVPGVLVTLPPGGSRTTVLAVHAALFAVLHQVVMKTLWVAMKRM